MQKWVLTSILILAPVGFLLLVLWLLMRWRTLSIETTHPPLESIQQCFPTLNNPLRKNTHWFVTRQGLLHPQVIAFCAITHYPTHWLLHTNCTMPRQRQQGLATMNLRAALQFCRHRDSQKEVRIQIHPHNVAALKALTRHPHLLWRKNVPHYAGPVNEYILQ